LFFVVVTVLILLYQYIVSLKELQAFLSGHCCKGDHQDNHSGASDEEEGKIDWIVDLIFHTFSI